MLKPLASPVQYWKREAVVDKTQHSIVRIKPTKRIVEACRGQCTNKQSQLIYQNIILEHERIRFVKHEKFKVKSQFRQHVGTFW